MRLVFRECARAMRLPLLFNTIAVILTGTLDVIIANTLGSFTDAAFELNFTLGQRNILLLTACILAAVLVGPAIELFCNFIMLKHALLHDIIVFEHYLEKSPEKAMAMDTGEVQYQLEDAPTMLRIYLVTILSQVFSLPFCFGYLLYCAGRINWLLTGVMLLLALTRLITPLIFRTKLAGYEKAAQAYRAKRRSYEADIISRPYINKLLGIQKPVLDRAGQLFIKYYQETKKHAITCEVFSEQAQELVNKTTLLLLFVSGAVMIAGNHITPGEFTSMLVYLTVAQTLFQNLGTVIQNYPLLINDASRVCEFYQDAEHSSGILLDHFPGLKAEEISFAFGDKNVLHNLDFSISPGEKVGIRGANGSGKSTFIRIICAMLKSYRGVITIGNLDFKKIHPDDWRRLIAYAPQNPYLFSTTVRENIMMANPAIEKETVDDLMNDFGILPLADRIISTDSGLSGGEKQKISILRALVKDSELLILDEPSNHLDAASVTTLKNYITATDKTVIVISHDNFLLGDLTSYEIKNRREH